MDHGVLRIVTYSVESVNGEEITAKIRRALADVVQVEAENWHKFQAGWREERSAAGGSVRLGWADVPPEATWKSVDPQMNWADLKSGKPFRWHDDALSREVGKSLQEHRARRTIDHNLLEEVTKVYRAADTAPTKAVMEHYGVSPAQASRYVAAARRDGYLPPRHPGKD